MDRDALQRAEKQISKLQDDNKQLKQQVQTMAIENTSYSERLNKSGMTHMTKTTTVSQDVQMIKVNYQSPMSMKENSGINASIVESHPRMQEM